MTIKNIFISINSLLIFSIFSHVNDDAVKDNLRRIGTVIGFAWDTRFSTFTFLCIDSILIIVQTCP